MLQQYKFAVRFGMDKLIQSHAITFRNALDAVSATVWKQCTVTNFPHGACGHTSELFARYIRRKLGIEPTYACGDVGHLLDEEQTKHAWLEYDGCVIDLTADQFQLAPVIVSRSSSLHMNAIDVRRYPIINDGWFAEYAAPVWRAALTILDQPD